jgi:CheY-like chemotaxis protein
VGWLSSYRHEWLLPDILAGVAVWAVMVPESMAYSATRMRRDSSRPMTRAVASVQASSPYGRRRNDVSQKLIGRILTMHGHNVQFAGNGREALAVMDREHFDLFVTDVQMPEMAGFEVTAVIRNLEQQTGRHLPIIALTAFAMRGDRERCLQAGMDGYVSKPVRTEELFNVIA